VIRFARFWWDFVVGDDWRIAAGIAVAIGAVALLHREDVASWWVLPAAVPLLLYVSLLRAARGSGERRRT
jgi:hypothetical protein